MAAGDTAEQRFAVAAGELTVTLQVCGRSASITRAVIAPAPVVGPIVAPAAVAAGETFTASAPFVLGAGWSPTGATWAAGTCGGEAAMGGSVSANATVSDPITFDEPGGYCVTVVVSFRHELGNEASSGQSTGVVATPTSSTTTSTSPATSTSTTSTSTTVAPTTTTTSPPTTVVTTTAPTTVVSTTAPTTAAPATTTTTAPTPTTAAPTTARARRRDDPMSAEPTLPPLSAPGPTATASAPTELSTADVTWFGEMFRRLLANVARRLHGKDDQIGYALVALVSEGHILLEDVPGVGKTSLARAIAESVSGTWNRVQFTPDLLPSDITGVSIFNQATREFEFRPGPIFANVVIGDEINRTSPKTQSALLEVMEERRVTVDGVAHLVPRPFVVVATQNPVDMDAGTYALPEAQLDRFLLKMSMGYPDAVAEAGIVLSRHGGAPGPLDPVLSLADIERMVAIGSCVRTDPQVVRYTVSLVQATRQMADVRLGASPRGTIGLLRAAQTMAAAAGRAYVTADDVKRLAVPVLAHRLVVAPTAQLRGVTAERVIIDLLGRLAVPGGAVD